MSPALWVHGIHSLCYARAKCLRAAVPRCSTFRHAVWLECTARLPGSRETFQSLRNVRRSAQEEVRQEAVHPHQGLGLPQGARAGVSLLKPQVLRKAKPASAGLEEPCRTFWIHNLRSSMACAKAPQNQPTPNSGGRREKERELNFQVQVISCT